jgi:hypothetical protein
MGFYFRKSVRIGPVRFNFSKSGVGASIGVKGFRYGVHPTGGTYIHAGRHGFYYHQELGGRRRKGPVRPELPPPPNQPTDEFEVISASNLAKTSASNLQDLLRTAYGGARMDYLAGGGALIGFIVLCRVGWFIAGLYACLGVLATAYFAYWETRRRTVYLHYETDGIVLHAFQEIISGFNQLAACKGVWAETSARSLVSMRERKTFAGATTLSDRQPAVFGEGVPPWVEANVPVPTIKSRGQTFYFLPDGLLVYDGSGVGHLSYRDLQIGASTSTFIATHPPSDAEIVGQTWMHPNKNGGPDSRFANNFPIPLCRYGECTFVSPSGQLLQLQTSRAEAPEGLRIAVERALTAISSATGGDAFLPAAAVNEEHFETGIDAIHSALRGVGKAVKSATQLVDSGLGQIAGEGNDILHWFLRIVAAMAVCMISTIVAIIAINQSQPAAEVQFVAAAPTTDSQQMATAPKVTIPVKSIVAGHPAEHAADASESRQTQRETSNENRQPSDAAEASIQTRSPVSFPKQIENRTQSETTKPEIAAEPEATKPASAAASPQVEQTPSSQSFLNDFHSRLSAQIAKVALEDTSSKRDEAHRKMMKVFDEQLKSRTLTLRFPIEDVAKGKTSSDSALILGPPAEAVGADGFRAAFKYYSVHLTPDEASNLKRGDALVLKGTGRFGSGSAVEAQVKGTLLVLRFSSKVSRNDYGVFLQNPTHNIEHGKNQ